MKVEEKKQAKGPAGVRCRVIRGMRWTGLEGMLAGSGQELSNRDCQPNQSLILFFGSVVSHGCG